MKIEYNNLYTHFVFTTLNRMSVILEKSRERIEKYITGIVNNNACKMYAIYANPEHVHFLVSRSPQLDEESLATIVANSSEKFINDNHLCVGIFQWQQSCSAFSVSKRNIHDLCEYIANQKEHHKKYSYDNEYENTSNSISKPFTKRIEKQMNNEVIRLYVFAIMWATEVVLLLKSGENEVCLSGRTDKIKNLANYLQEINVAIKNMRYV